MRVRPLALLVLASLAANAGADDAPPWSRPRELPSLIVRWQRAGKPCALTIRDGVVYALEPGFTLASYRGPLNAVGYDVVVRKTPRGWLVRYR